MAAIEFCPKCAGVEFYRLNGGEELLCKNCGSIVGWHELSFSDRRMTKERAIMAVVFLVNKWGRPVTRRETADHLGLKYTPAFVELLEGLVERGVLEKQMHPHHINTRPAWYYARTGKFVFNGPDEPGPLWKAVEGRPSVGT